MHRSLVRWSMLLTGLAIVATTSRALAQNPNVDFGTFVQGQLSAHAEQLFGFRRPLTESALGPYDGPDNLQAITVAPGLQVSLVSSVVASAADQIAFWPNDENPTHVFVCDEETSTPSVQRVDLSGPANANVTTIVTGLSSCDPVRRTAVGHHHRGRGSGADGGLYELIDPANINTAINVSDRGRWHDQRSAASGETQGRRTASRGKGIAVAADGTMIYGDELAPSGGNAGGGVYKFVPSIPFQGGAAITVPGQSPLAAGTHLRPARRRVGLVELGPGRRDRQGRVGGRRPERHQCRRR